MKKIIIVGAGISGLTAGVYALQSGFDVTIYESHTIPGGASTSWRRKGYLFEGGMHWLTGSSPETAMYKLWRNIGALDDNTAVYNRDPFFTVEYNGQTANVYRDADKLRQHLIGISPEDENEINRLCKDIKKLTVLDMPITDIKGVKVKEKSNMKLSSLFGMLTALPRISFYTNQTSNEYSQRFKNPLLQQIVKNFAGEENNAAALVFTLSCLYSGDGGYPEGGSLTMARRIADKFEALGGIIKFGTPVNKVITRNGTADGVLVNGNEILADAVIVTQDTRAAIDNLFDTPICEPWADKMRREIKPMLNTFISIGVEADLSALPESLYFNIDTPLSYGGMNEYIIGINNYATYKGYAPDGCTALTSILSGDTYEFWKQCKQNGTYEAEKQKLAEAFIKILNEKWPQTKDKIAVWDVATPLTYERYLSSYKGSWMSFMEKGRKMESFPSKPEGIKNLYFAGQRLTVPGGLPVAAETGRKAVQYLCRDTDTVFQGQM